MNDLNRIVNKNPLEFDAQDTEELIKYYQYYRERLRQRVEKSKKYKPVPHEPIPQEDIDAALAFSPKQKPLKRRV